MICDFPAIYAKICDEISALPPAAESCVSTELQQFRVFISFKISIFPSVPPPYNLYAFRA